MSIPLHLLILEDNPAEAELIVAALQEAGYCCTWQPEKPLEVKSGRVLLAHKQQPGQTHRAVSDYQRAVRHAPVVLFALDLQGVCTMAEGKGLDIFQLDPETVIGQQLFDIEILTPEIREDVRTALQGQSLHVTRKIQENYVETFYEPIYAVDGQLEGVAGVTLDVTEQIKTLYEHRQAEQALRESEERFRGFVTSISDHIYVTEVTSEGTYRNLYLSPHVETLTGYSGEALLADWSLWASQIIHPADRPAAAAQLAQLTAGQNSEVEYRLVKASGEIIWVRDSARVQAESFSARLIYGVVSDITHRKQAEEEIRQLNEELEQRVLDRTRELLALYEVSAVASEALDLETTLKLSLARVLTAMRSGVGLIHLLDETDQTLYLMTGQGLLPEVEARLKVSPFGSDLISRALSEGETVVIPNLRAAGYLPEMAAMSHLVTYAGAPIRVRGEKLGVLSVFGHHEQQFSMEEVALLASIADQVGIVIENARLRQQAEKTAIIEERNRLARELHDSVTQSLYSLTLFSEVGQELIQAENLAALKQTMSQISAISQQALKEMRLLVHELRPLDLQREGLVGALHRRLSAVEGRSSTKARLIVEDWIELPSSMEEALYRIAQEALNNALKHTKATNVNIYLRLIGDSIELEVADNGEGFQPQKAGDHGGLGLVSMQERAEKLGGVLTIRSAPEKGTQVKVRVKAPGEDVKGG